MKYLIIVFIILLAFVGFQFISFVGDEIREVQDTSIFEFEESSPKEISSGSKVIVNDLFEHKLTLFDFSGGSLITATVEKEIPYILDDGDDFYVTFFYLHDSKLIQEDHLVEDNGIDIELAYELEGDLVISLPVLSSSNSWCVRGTNMSHDNLSTYTQTLTKEDDLSQQQLYLIEPDNTGYYTMDFESLHNLISSRKDSDDVPKIKLEFELIKK